MKNKYRVITFNIYLKTFDNLSLHNISYKFVMFHHGITISQLNIINYKSDKKLNRNY